MVQAAATLYASASGPGGCNSPSPGRKGTQTKMGLEAFLEIFEQVAKSIAGPEISGLLR